MHQVLHTDQSHEAVRHRLANTGSGSRGRGDAIPYSAIGAFEEGGSCLYVIEGSHKQTQVDGLSYKDVKRVIIPKGYVLVFSSLLVHAGCEYALTNGRVHFYLRSEGSAKTSEGKFYPIREKDKEVPVGLKKQKNNNSKQR